MDENILRFRVGVFVVIAMLILGILIFLNSEGWKTQYTIYIKPVSAPGVTVNTPIRKHGILIGRVNSVETEDDHVVLKLGIDDTAKIYANEVPSIGTGSFFGDAVIEVLPLSKDERGELVVQGHTMAEVAVKRNPMELVDVAMNLETKMSDTLTTFQEAGTSIQAASDGVSKLTQTVQGAFDDPNSDFKKLLVEFRGMSEKAKLAIDNFNRIFENVNDIVGDESMKGEIKRTISNLPLIFDDVRGTISDIRGTIADTRSTINSFKGVAGKATKTFENLEVFSGALKDDGTEIIEKVNDSLDNVDELVENITEFTETLSKIKTDEGTIGKLLNETEVYDDIKASVENIRKLSVQLEPLARDLRSFGDSLARDPSLIGLKGALDRRPPKTGYKGSAGGNSKSGDGGRRFFNNWR